MYVSLIVSSSRPLPYFCDIHNVLNQASL
jgi:hypothetical protein